MSKSATHRASYRSWTWGLALGALIYASAGWTAIGRTPGSFSVSQSGEANYTVPLFAPPGTAKMSPKLSLSYGHRAGGSWLGEGWGVSGLSAITRCPKTWAQDGLSREVKLDLTDRYCLDGTQLRWFLGAYGGNGAMYRTEMEQFASIESTDVSGVTGGPGYFTVKTKDGLIYDYGTREDSRIQAIGTSTVAVWALTTIRDRAGNRIEFTYDEDTSNGSYQISYVDWTSNPGQSLSAAYRMQFFYDTQPAGEIESGYLMGTGVKDIKRMSRVDVTYNTALVRRYPLVYETNLSSTSRSRLASVSECAGASGTDCLSPITFNYNNGTNGIGTAVAVGATTAEPTATMAMDVNGDGRTDLVYPSTNVSGTGVWMVALATTSGSYGTPLSSGIANVNFSRAIPIDYNADGLDDLLFPDASNVWQVALGTSTGLGAATSLGLAAAAAGSTATALDVDGDGLEDLVELIPDPVNGDLITYRLRVPAGSFGTVTGWFGPGPNYYISAFGLGNDVFRRRARAPDFNGDGHGDLLIAVTDCTAGITSCFTYYEGLLGGSAGGIIFTGLAGLNDVAFADLNGDRYTDIVVRNGGYWYAWYGVGAAFVGSGTVSGPVGTGAYRAVIHDWDHDGYEDILTVGASGNWFVIRSTGVGLAAPVDTGVYAGTLSTGFAADVNGDDLDDVIFADSGGVLRFHLHSGVKPDLLASATDGYGNVVTFSYTSIVQNNYQKYSDAVLPGGAGYAGYQDYQGPLYVVSQYTATDGTDGNAATTYTISYWYYGAWMHRQGRGFTGFYAQRTYDSRNSIVDYSYFIRQFPYTGSQFWRDVLPLSGTLISQSVQYWTYSTLGSGTDARHWPYVYQDEQKEYETNGPYNGAQLRRVLTVRQPPDLVSGDFTDVTVTTTEGSGANGLNPNATHTVRTQVTSLLQDLGTWCLGRPEFTQVTSSHSMTYGSAQTRTSDSLWDAANCRPYWTRQQPGDPSAVTTVFGYDGFGNLNSETVSGTGLPARTTSSNWGSTGQFPHSITNALSQVTNQTWNLKDGTKASVTDPNGLLTQYSYDDFGRITAEYRPDGTYVGTTRGYCGPGSGCDARVRMWWVATEYTPGSVAIRADGAHLDWQDRPINDLSYSFTGFWSTVSRHFEASGNESHESVPYTWGGSPIWASKFYDIRNRPISHWRYVSSTDFSYQTVVSQYNGLTTTVTDENGKQKSTISNGIGKTVRSIDHDGYWQGFDWDAFGNAKRVIDSASVVLQDNSYNIRGFKTASTDADMGSWTYVPNPLGEVGSQTDANGKTITIAYDALGRVTSKSEPAPGGGTIQDVWQWGTSAAAKNIGQLEWTRKLLNGVVTYQEAFYYDTVARPIQVQYYDGATSHAVDYGYDASTGRLDTTTYPVSTSGYRHKVKHDYQYGKPLRVKECTSSACSSFGTTYWTANAEDVRGNVVDELLGNGLRTQRTVDSTSGFLGDIRTGPNGGTPTTVQNLTFAFDKVGNLTQRQDLNQSRTEVFSYDNLHRLTGSTLNGTANLAMTYYANGNINTRWETGGPTLTYTYHTTKIHAVTATSNGWAYQYDANGNVTLKNGNAVTWFASNKPQSISNGTYSSTFDYGPAGNYFRQVATYSNGSETSLYIGGLLEIVSNSSTGITAYRHQIKAGGRTVAVYSRGSNGAQNTIYPLQDHLGSTEAITDSSGAVIVRESFAAFGARRGSNWAGQPTSGDMSAIADATRRGFTQHTMLDNIGLVHMNGRVYDPAIGRFLSADPNIDGALNTQGWNRYSYVLNNPLSYTDPTGYWSFKKLWKKVLRPLAAIAAGIFIPGMQVFAANALVGAMVGGAASGAIATGSLRGAIQGAFSGALFHAASFAGNPGSLSRVAAHTAAGCASSVAAGGDCGSGAIGAGVANVAGQYVGDFGNSHATALTHGLVGGASASLAGGSFGYGFASGAFGYEFNEYIETAREARARYAGNSTGHHWVPFGSTDKMDLSVEARRAFGEASSGGSIPNSVHNVGHNSYNRAVRQELLDFAQVNNIDLSRMTSSQAREFVSQVRASNNPSIRFTRQRVEFFLAAAPGTQNAIRLVSGIGMARAAENLYPSPLRAPQCQANDSIPGC